ncbi:GGDEF domain-containing protein [Paenibacillus soyae]|uniref:GGDEF domain-containing protein n=1 Tax=Paenibacillus soyae TaxID=2969249 RepID=A0A9X2MV27_9BACL|nr:GGDEF domain-containing protein [Paenibacillus soyae]MCR2806401.1 GGDEF domain-containing protein [Paenibacillus soyae]
MSYPSFFPVTPFMAKVLGTYWLFSFLYYHLRISSKKGSTSIEYGINYNVSLVMFAGPFGLMLFETVFRAFVYGYKKLTKTEEPMEGAHAFYNVGSFSLQGIAAYYLFQALIPYAKGEFVSYWLLMIGIIVVTAVLSDLFLIIVFTCLGDIKTLKDVYSFVKSRSLLDLAKTALSNGLLILFLYENNWTAVFGLFLLNYLVSQSYLIKAQSVKDRDERDKYEQMAYTDFLTGVQNRAYLDAKLKEWKESDEPFGIIVTDIDKFKSINDSYNHHVGDRVIQHFAMTLKQHLRSGDVLIRSGGEEFLIFLRQRSHEQCLAIAEEIRAEAERTPVKAEYGDRTAEVRYTASFGLYYSPNRDAVSLEKSCVMADQLLLQAKQEGRNRVVASEGV